MEENVDAAVQDGGAADAADAQEQQDAAQQDAQHKAPKAPQSERQQQISKLLSTYRCDKDRGDHTSISISICT